MTTMNFSPGTLTSEQRMKSGRYLALDTGFQTDQGIDLDAFIQLFASSAELQERAQITAQGAMKSPNEFGVFCLTDAPDSEQMWQEYADNGRGFVISFDTAHPGFSLLTSPGRLGKVDYSDKPFGTFLGTFFSEGAGVFYRKRMKYAFENEWRQFAACTGLNAVAEISISPSSIHSA